MLPSISSSVRLATRFRGLRTLGTVECTLHPVQLRDRAVPVSRGRLPARTTTRRTRTTHDTLIQHMSGRQ
eukprot:scaffold2742_cov130-Isochrysis_galbana.AAC.2